MPDAKAEGCKDDLRTEAPHVDQGWGFGDGLVTEMVSDGGRGAAVARAG